MPKDTNEIRQNVRISDVAARFGLKLEKRGKEFWCSCPFHAEKTASFSIFYARNVRQERFYCYGCEEHGDVIHFTQAIKGLKFLDACELLKGDAAGPANRKPVEVEHEDPYAKLSPVPMDDHPFKVGERAPLFNPKSGIISSCRPQMIHEYRDAAGKLLGLVLRLPTVKDPTKKETPTVRLARLGNRLVWARWAFAEPRPLYGLDKLRGQQVVLVEGEKCKDFFAKACPDRPVVTWPGGTQSVDRVDWRPLHGKDIISWADHDAPGSKAMRKIKALAKASRFRGIDTWAQDEALHEKGWDCADMIAAGATTADVEGYIRRNLREIPDWADEPVPPPPEPNLPPKTEILPQRAEAPKPSQEMIVKRNEEVEAWPEREQLIVDEDGVNKKVGYNWTLFTRTHPQLRGVFRLNTFANNIELMRPPPWDNGKFPRFIRETDYTFLAHWFEQMWRSPMKVSPLREAVAAAAYAARYDPLEDYINGLEWDGVPRIDRWLHTYVGTVDSHYTRRVGAMWLVSGIARGLEPGCKVDTALVLESSQGQKKSSLFHAIFGNDWFNDQMPRLDDKDASIALAGRWGIEFAEMHSIGKSTADAAKAFMSRKVDRYRPPYGSVTADFPRRCIFGGTVNPDGGGYLLDPTGNRRWWPVRLISPSKVDLVVRDRDQLWAEALVRYNETHCWWIDEASEENLLHFKPEQQRRTERDPWALILENWLAGQEEVTYASISATLEIPSERQSRQISQRIAVVMDGLGYYRSADKLRFRKKKAA